LTEAIFKGYNVFDALLQERGLDMAIHRSPAFFIEEGYSEGVQNCSITDYALMFQQGAP
jgi:hypothetical protein